MAAYGYIRSLMICRVARAMALIDWKYASQNHRACEENHTAWSEQSEGRTRGSITGTSGSGSFPYSQREQAQGKSLPAVQGNSIRVGIHPRQSNRTCAQATHMESNLDRKETTWGWSIKFIVFFFNITTKVHIKYIQSSYNHYPDIEHSSTPGESSLLHPASISPLQE